MNTLFRSIGIMVTALALVLWLPSPSVFAQSDVQVAEQLEKALQLYSDLEFDKGLQLTEEILKRPDLARRDSLAVYSIASMLLYGKGEEYVARSYTTLERMADLGPCTIHLPDGFWPQQLRDQWYRILKTKNALICPEEGDREIRNIAIVEFDNFSVGKYQEELGFVTKGLADFFEADFSQISSLKVIERDKVDYILREIELTKSGLVEAGTAVQVGKLLGAQIMVFGSITQIDDQNARMLVKAVAVETSEIIASVEKEGRPNFFKMEKELVKELSEKLNITLAKETVTLLDESGTESLDAATLYSKGLYYQDKYDYKQAYEFFKQAYEKDNTFAEAKRKMDIYRPLAIS